MQRPFLIAFLAVASASLRAATIRLASDLPKGFNSWTSAAAPAHEEWVSCGDTGGGRETFSLHDGTRNPPTVFTDDFALPDAVDKGPARVWAGERASDFADINLNGLSHSLTLSVSRSGRGASGWLHCGSVTSEAAPEPRTFLLIGAGLLGLATLLRRLKS